MKKRGLFILLAAVQIFAFAQCVRAQELTGEQNNTMLRPLVGITELGVVVEELSEDAKKINLTKDDIQKIVEMKLRTAGIKVLSYQESMQTADVTYLYVTSTVSETGGNLFSANVRMEIVESSCLESNTACDEYTTYHRGRSLSAEKNSAGQWIKDNIKDVADYFLSDYVKANPGAQPPQPIELKPN